MLAQLQDGNGKAVVDNERAVFTVSVAWMKGGKRSLENHGEEVQGEVKRRIGLNCKVSLEELIKSNLNNLKGT